MGVLVSNFLQPEKDAKMNELQLDNNLKVYSVGSNDKKPLPGIFYFALSGKDSLELDPFNQPVNIWKQYPLRVYSMTIPGHEETFTKDVAITKWKEEFAKGNDILSPFFDHVIESITLLIEKELLDPKKIATAGLSRGGLVAASVAAKCPHISHILGYAPVTNLKALADFDHAPDNFTLIKLADQLYDRTHRYYIGNHDTRVSTRQCYEYVEELAKNMHKNRISSMPVELFLTPSIGRHGHGTAKHIFEQGAHWLAKTLLQ